MATVVCSMQRMYDPDLDVFGQRMYSECTTLTLMFLVLMSLQYLPYHWQLPEENVHKHIHLQGLSNNRRFPSSCLFILLLIADNTEQPPFRSQPLTGTALAATHSLRTRYRIIYHMNHG